LTDSATAGSWSLAVDFGTTFTVGAVCDGPGADPSVVYPEGKRNPPLMPSAVWRDDDGQLVIGNDALNQAVFAPERFERTPKRQIGKRDLALGADRVPMVEVVAAVISCVGNAAMKERGGTKPRELRLTHPAAWTNTRLKVLTAAANHAGLPAPTLIPEPVAAALEIGGDSVDVGQYVAIYDFGGGTFDAAVVRRTEQGFRVVGRPGGKDPLGGEDIDRRILEYMTRELPIGQDSRWPLLMKPPDTQWRRARAGLRSEIRRAKEGLSEGQTRKFWVPGIEREQQLTRRELNGLIQKDVEQTVEILKRTVERACALEELAAVYLVGGSSKISLVADVIWDALKLQPADDIGDPKEVVALGAARAPTAASAPTDEGDQSAVETRILTGAHTRPLSTPSGPPIAGERFRARLAMATALPAWDGPVTCFAALELTDGSLEVWVEESPAEGENTEDRASRADRAWAEVPGYRELSLSRVTVLANDAGLERVLVADRGGTGVEWIQRYLVSDGRALVVTAHQAARPIAETLRVKPRLLEERKHYEPSFVITVPEGWSVRERVSLVRRAQAGNNGGEDPLRGNRTVIAESVPLPGGASIDEWMRREADVRASALRATPEGPRPDKVFGHDGAAQFSFAGDDGTLTRLWLCAIDGRGYVISTTLPLYELSRYEKFRSLVFKRHRSQVRLTSPEMEAANVV